MSFFFKTEEQPWEEVGEGIRRQIVGYTDNLMAVHVCFAKGAVGELHAHDEHDQVAFVAAGSFEVSVDGVTKVLTKGDAYTAPKHVVHGAVALEDNSVLVDVFSPKRAEFL